MMPSRRFAARLKSLRLSSAVVTPRNSDLLYLTLMINRFSCPRQRNVISQSPALCAKTAILLPKLKGRYADAGIR